SATIPAVFIGNPGNPSDTRYIDSNTPPNGFGSVAYSFNIGKTEVTHAQYVAFLNAVAKSDPYGLYSTTSSGIVRSGTSGSYSYSVRPDVTNVPPSNTTYTFGDKP